MCKKQYNKENPVNKIPQHSEKRAKQELVYKIKKKKYMAEHKICERCNNEPSEDLHHKKGRIGDLLTDERYFMAVSRECHDWIHLHPIESRENNWLI